jgi:hypothetical protein
MAVETAAVTWTWATVVPVVASMIALIGVAYSVHIQTRNFRRQIKSAHTLKVAEMRQVWINNLRDSMAKFQSYGVTPSVAQQFEREFYEYGTRIELLMNPNDANYCELKQCMYAYLKADDITAKYMANPALVDICQRILKSEWETLKNEISEAAK